MNFINCYDLTIGIIGIFIATIIGIITTVLSEGVIKKSIKNIVLFCYFFSLSLIIKIFYREIYYITKIFATIFLLACIIEIYKFSKIFGRVLRKF